MRIVAISDTHTLHNDLVLPEGDVLVHAGDGTISGNMKELLSWAQWMREQTKRFKYVVFIGGNHDFALEHFMREGHEALVHEMFHPAYYLRDESLHIEGKNFYGAPWIPQFEDWAFNMKRGPVAKETWAKIPMYTNVLVTHCPPYGTLDWFWQHRLGCEDLADRIAVVQPEVHIFGHIHNAYGERTTPTTRHYNATVTAIEKDGKGNDCYTLPDSRKPWVIDL